jgi:uncharacterized protein (TIGR02246 family)
MEDVRERARFEEGIRSYLDAFNAGDFETVSSYWAEDAVTCPPVGGELRGRPAIREYYRAAFSQMAPQLSDYACDFVLAGDLAMVRESWTVTMNPPGQAPLRYPGRSLWTARLEADGVWRGFWMLARLDG